MLVADNCASDAGYVGIDIADAAVVASAIADLFLRFTGSLSVFDIPILFLYAGFYLIADSSSPYPLGTRDSS